MNSKDLIRQIEDDIAALPDVDREDLPRATILAQLYTALAIARLEAAYRNAESITE